MSNLKRYLVTHVYSKNYKVVEGLVESVNYILQACVKCTTCRVLRKC